MSFASLSRWNTSRLLCKLRIEGLPSTGYLSVKHGNSFYGPSNTITASASNASSYENELACRTATEGSSTMCTSKNEKIQPYQEQKRVLLLLSGIPGSGKTFFSHQLIDSCNANEGISSDHPTSGSKDSRSNATRGSWVHVNQDTIKRGGKRGTRQQCIQAVREALEQGYNCILDRCNFDAEQRSDFILLAQSLGVEVHALVLNLPVPTCKARVMSRSDHPTLKPSKASAGIVYRVHKDMYQELGAPGKDVSIREDYASLSVCCTEGDVATALKVWRAYSANDTEIWKAGLQSLRAPPSWTQHKRKDPPKIG